MSSRTNICDLNVKDLIESTFLVKSISLLSSRDGKKYIGALLSDATGELDTRIWNNSEKIYSEISTGDYVRVKGKVNIFQGRKQFIASEINFLDKSEIDRGEFIIKAKVDPEIMFKSLMEIVSRLEDIYIKELLENILGDKEIARRLKLWQAGKTIHHAYQSGLLEHVLSCATLGDSLSDHYQVNKSYVVAGCILHDICKIYELSDGDIVEYTEEGKLIGHLVKVLEVVDRFSYKIKNFPYNVKLHLKHILLSHHGEYEYGSPKIPQTKEAYLVHLIDLMDSKMNSMDTISRTDNNSGHWSSYVKHMDRIVFKEDLPTYSEPVDPKEVISKKKGNDPKTNLGNLLKDFKV
jgi:3'-5' exoribonuclease